MTVQVIVTGNVGLSQEVMDQIAEHIREAFDQRDVIVMREPQFKQYMLRLLREAINEEDKVLIQPDSHQALILRND